MKQSKPQLIMIPGLICDERLFASQISALEKSFEIQVVNHRRELSLDEIAFDVIEESDDEFYLLGLSMGGYICFEIVRQLLIRNELDRIKKLVLMSTSPRADEADMEKRRYDFMELAKRGKFRGMSPMLMSSFIHPSKLEDKAITQTIFDMAHSTGPEGFINQSKMVLGRPDSTDTLPQITTQTMVMCGVDDQRTPLNLSIEMAELIPNSELITFANCGHLPPLEVPEDVNKYLLNFLVE